MGHKKTIDVLPCTGNPDISLNRVVTMLNHDESFHLRQLVARWKKSGPNLQKLLDADRELHKLVGYVFQVVLLATKSGGAQLAMTPGNHLDLNSREDIDLLIFVELLLNPQWEKLGGPCDRCRKYYIKKTARQKAYCSRSCGTAATARQTTLKRRAERHTDKLRRAAEAAQRWGTSASKLNWKEWVSKQQPDITPKWLTRAVNKGELQPTRKKKSDRSV
jgi:hypothetical protein